MNLTPVEKKNLNRRATQNTEAYQNYLKGRFFWAKRTNEDLETAVKYFEKAIEIDNKYALAWAGIADSYYLMPEYGTLSRKELYPKAITAIYKALEFDNKLSEAHASLASWTMLNDWDWINALKEFKLAVKLNPNYATAHHWYSDWLLFNGYFKESLIEISKAVELDPLSAPILKDKGLILYYSREYDSAIEFAMKSIELYPNLVSSYRLLSLAYHGKGMYEEAILENQKWDALTDNKVESSAALAYFYASAGRRKEALKLIDDLNLNEKINSNLFRGIALVYTALGEKDLAFTWFEKAYENKAESLCITKIDPKLDPIRDDPRFKLLLAKIGL
jgi:tetratricopeptide (TPR) repeat protein